MSKAKGGVSNKKWELIGDSLINLVIAEHLDKLPETIGTMYAPHYLRSNKHLAQIADRIPVTFKYKNGKKRGLVEKGDEVEYYVAFLYLNYGVERARAFLIENLFSININYLKDETT